MANATTEEKSAKSLSDRGVDAVEKFFERKGYTILKRDWSCSEGSFDLICEDGDMLCFIEVKTRRLYKESGLPNEGISEQKRSKFEKIAAEFLKTYDKVDIQVRFDIVTLLILSEDRAFLRHHINAFGN